MLKEAVVGEVVVEEEAEEGEEAAEVGVKAALNNVEQTLFAFKTVKGLRK